MFVVVVDVQGAAVKEEGLGVDGDEGVARHLTLHIEDGVGGGDLDGELAAGLGFEHHIHVFSLGWWKLPTPISTVSLLDLLILLPHLDRLYRSTIHAKLCKMRSSVVSYEVVKV